MKVLNVGGGAARDLPPLFRGWDCEVLDIDPQTHPDILMDARDMRKVRTKYDAVHSSHTLEHFYRHEVEGILRGFVHVLKPAGFVSIVVPNLSMIFEKLKTHDVFDQAYQSASGAVSFHDMLYGWNKVMAQGNLYFAHKCGFTAKSLTKCMLQAGAKKVYSAEDNYFNLFAYGFLKSPSKAQLQRMGI